MAEPVVAKLAIILGGRAVGTLIQNQSGRLTIEYAKAWSDDPGATPLSLSMPIAQRLHTEPVVRAFLEGLLPDNDRVLERWARTYQVSARNPFALLGHVGEDCAGAARFVAPDRVKENAEGTGGIEWLTEDELAERLRGLREDPANWHLSATGQFSLAGAQAKTALYFDDENKRWGQPRGAVPTTHILKPAVAGFDDHDLNEHLCLSAARRVGLNVVHSELLSFRDQRVIAVRRYDRVRLPEEGVVRVHQEDLCQALGVPPSKKYQNEGGPTPEHIIALLRSSIQPAIVASESIRRFVDALAFNWIIGGTDAHAKNYSLVLSGRQVRLALLYDVASILPYDGIYAPKLRAAMRIGGEYRLERISGKHWRRFAAENDIDSERMMLRIDRLASEIADAFQMVASEPSVVELHSDLPRRLADVVAARAVMCRTALR